MSSFSVSYTLKCHTQSDFGKVTMQFKLEVCILQKPEVVGIRRQRLKGDAWVYKHLVEDILSTSSVWCYSWGRLLPTWVKWGGVCLMSITEKPPVLLYISFDHVHYYLACSGGGTVLFCHVLPLIEMQKILSLYTVHPSNLAISSTRIALWQQLHLICFYVSPWYSVNVMFLYLFLLMCKVSNLLPFLKCLSFCSCFYLW